MMFAPGAAACIGACLIEALSPERRAVVEQQVRTQGPARAVADLSSDGVGRGSRWDILMIAIESGDVGWLRVAGALRPGATGAAGEALLSALSTALRRNAPGVLGMMGPTIRAEDICYQRIDARPIDDKVFEVHTRNALVSVADPRLTALRDKCLAILTQHSEE
ncbi:hypothetical protein Q4F19_10105 [Sphingomonas sp. BIUV-7]|uniref:Uncharacterized protein n=1 Tax=Sphingomonas natans TaxID=3063330 RepID=A0ABT8Y8S9_9SPHN|nr:hypothetical protein [Sphingomonas sp. BIUV-7]MDO6414731.1 hypothetical protein [Sphingomonas sp. BIUV-7]